jgi:hypothetical protein
MRDMAAVVNFQYFNFIPQNVLMPLKNVEGDICRCRGRSSEIRHFEVAQYASIVLNNLLREMTVLGGTSSPMTDHNLA